MKKYSKAVIISMVLVFAYHCKSDKSSLFDEAKPTATTAKTDTESVTADKSVLSVSYGGSDNASSITQNFALSTSTANGTTIIWTSDDAAISVSGGSATEGMAKKEWQRILDAAWFG